MGADQALAIDLALATDLPASLDMAPVDALGPDQMLGPDAPVVLDSAALDVSSGDAAGPLDDFTRTDIGGFKLGPLLNGGVVPTGLVPGPGGCTQLAGIVRDFRGLKEPSGHPDFEAFLGEAPTPGLVSTVIGVDGKPVYASMCETPGLRTTACPYAQQTTSALAFRDWYHFVEGVNKPYLIYFLLVPEAGLSTFASKHYFPLDNTGWGNSGLDAEANPHNFHFTTELHVRFQYGGGERFNLTGDDDVWVFVNGQVAIDVGGLHKPAFASLDSRLPGGQAGPGEGQRLQPGHLPRRAPHRRLQLPHRHQHGLRRLRRAAALSVRSLPAAR
jgi:hypothetical protein